MVYPLLMQVVAAAALMGPGSATDHVYDGAAGDLTVATPSLADADIRVDGRLDEASWQQAAVLGSFTQYDPVEGAPASQKTEVLVLVDRGAIYFGVRAFDDDPNGIRATLAERDEFDRSDDYIRFVLDTFDDQRRAYVFSVNPLGVQHDGIWNEGSGGRHMGPPIDDNPDFLWESSGELAEWGYQLEVRIPLKSLRFPERVNQSWGLQVIRKISRNGYEESWAPISNNVANQLTQAGKLTDLRELDAGLFMEINPVLTGKRVGTVDDETGLFTQDSPEGDFGLNMTYGLTSNLTLDATYNPDFSQVEADAGQISVNERFGLFFPEKRPFFLEGTEIFNLPKQLIYTRSIANPVGGAKMTGKVGAWQVGYLGAVDRSFDEGVDNTVANIVRARRDLGAASTVGMVYTDRTRHADDYNRVVGADARLVLAQRYTLTFLGSTSFSAEPDSAATVGTLWSGRVERAGRAFGFSAEIEDSDSDFDARSGFFRRTGDTQLQSNVRYNWYGPSGGLVERVGPSLEMHGYWDHDAFWSGGGAQEVSAQLGGSVSFRGNISVFANAKLKSYSFAPADYDGFFVPAVGRLAGGLLSGPGALRRHAGPRREPVGEHLRADTRQRPLRLGGSADLRRLERGGGAGDLLVVEREPQPLSDALAQGRVGPSPHDDHTPSGRFRVLLRDHPAREGPVPVLQGVLRTRHLRVPVPAAGGALRPRDRGGRQLLRGRRLRGADGLGRIRLPRGGTRELRALAGDRLLRGLHPTDGGHGGLPLPRGASAGRGRLRQGQLPIPVLRAAAKVVAPRSPVLVKVGRSGETAHST